jgi:homogentisate 1,2-dioxygenase
VLPFREYDYVLIPKSTPYRLCFDGDRATAIVFEGRPYIQIPGDYRNRFGQLSDFAPYSHRDFRVPQELLSPAALQSAGGAARASAGGAARASAARAGAPGGPFEMVVKMRDELTLHKYEHSPLDVVGWDGAVYPIAFNIRDYQPKTGLVHLPPTIHTTFAGEGFVICSFVPRRVDWHEKAIPCPYGHANVDMDEIMYYVEGAFTSRKGIEPESISLHPLGVPHGPHPGTYEKSIGARETKEMAVMCDTHRPLRLTTVADSVEDKQYHTSWVRREGGKDWTSK